MIDIVTVAFESELEVLQLQARSLELFVKDIDSIVVVVIKIRPVALIPSGGVCINTKSR
jgi:hypothetical protein